MRKKISLVLMVALLFTITSSMAFAATPEITVNVNGNKVIFTQPPVNQEGTVFVPIRKILEELNQTVEWDQATKVATATDKVTAMVTTINTKSTIVTTTQMGVKRSYTMPAVPVVINGSTLVPVRAISEIFAKDVEWDQATSTVNVKDITEAKALEIATTAKLILKDIVSIKYSTDGTYDYKVAANNDFVFVTDVAEGAGAHTMYFRAENVNKDAKIELQKIASKNATPVTPAAVDKPKNDTGKVMDTKTYMAVIADPCDNAIILLSETSPSAIVTKAKVGDYVKATVVDISGSTGYQWLVTSLPAGLQQVEVKTDATSSAGIAGAPSSTSFVFKVLAEGDMTLQLTNKRPWNDTAQTPKIENFKISVTK